MGGAATASLVRVGLPQSCLQVSDLELVLGEAWRSVDRTRPTGLRYPRLDGIHLWYGAHTNVMNHRLSAPIASTRPFC